MSIKSLLDLYQSRAISAAITALNKDGKALIRMATGTGKTETAIKLFETLDTSGQMRLLWLTHQNELVEQTAERFISRAVTTGKLEMTDVGVYNSKSRELNAKITVASIPTLSRGRNLESFSKADFDVIITDECHHGPATTWTKVINYFDGMKVGLTATPFRPDSMPLDEYFGDICYDLDFKKAQEAGLLAQDQNKVILTNSTLNGLVNRNGEYTAKQLDRLYTSLNRNQIIVKSYRKYARASVIDAGMTPKAICFCINIEHAKRMSAYFNEAGISSAYVCGSSEHLSNEDRIRIMDNFKHTNEIEIVCAVNILNEGVDIANANIAIMCRPTQSNIIYSQQLGRVARVDGGRKGFFFVLDFVDQTESKFTNYILNHLKRTKVSPETVITEYVQSDDPVKLEKRVSDIVKNVEEFEVGMRRRFDFSKVNLANLKKFAETNGRVELWAK